MKPTRLALSLTILIALAGLGGAVNAAEQTPAGVFLRGMTEVCTPWQAGAERKTLFPALKSGGWDVDLLPRLEGSWGTALFQVRLYGEKRGCNAMLTLKQEGDKTAATRAALDWVARTYPQMPMTHQNKPVQLKTGPVHAWTWADEKTSITFYAADSVAEPGPHVVLSIKPL